MNPRLTDGTGATSHVPNQVPRFYSVSQAAELIGTAPVTLYRAIRDGEFPAVRIRGRLIVPAKVLDAIVDAAVAEHGVIGASSIAPVTPARPRQA